MKLHEYQTKAIFRRYNIPVPRGRIASTPAEAKQIAEELGGKVVIKAQVLVGGRGKAGGVRLVKSPKEAEEQGTEVLAMDIKGISVRKVLVEETISLIKEIYLGITYDRSIKQPLLIASSMGGVDIEEVALLNPEKIIRVPIDPLLGLCKYQTRDIAIGIDLPREYWRKFSEIAGKLWEVFTGCDATLVETNPLVLTNNQSIVAIDGKMIIDDSALFRQTDISDMRDSEAENPVEIDARKYGLSYIQLNGDIGCMVNGAGLAMTSMDVINLVEGKPANFLDVGGGASAEKVAAAFRIILSDKNIKAILINIFGGITRCDEVAKGILSAIHDVKPEIMMVARLVGTNSEEGLRVLSQAHVITAESLLDAARKVVTAAKGA